MNGTTKKRCTELIRLCAGLDFFPGDSTVRDLLVATLQRVAASDDHASRIIERWMERERRSPLVADLVALSQEVNRTPINPVRLINTGCSECQGTGFAIIQKPYGITGAQRCTFGCYIPGGQSATTTVDRRAIWAMYQREHAEAAHRQTAFAQRQKHFVHQARPVTDEQIASLRDQQNARRRLEA